MPVHLDTPVAGAPLDPSDFQLRGWIWLEDRHSDLAAIEACDGELLLGTADAASLFARPDVSARYHLADGARTGFALTARHPSLRPGQTFTIALRVRWRDGARSPVVFARDLAVPPLERDPFRLLLTRVSPRSLGLEIGAHQNPAAKLSPFYTDAVVDFAGAAGRVDFLADARALPLPDATLDYLVSSHVIEHLPDPIAALHEWHRVLRPGGLLYLVAPDQRYTFDHSRPLTTTEHLLHDFAAGTTPSDAAAHIDEFVFQADWSMLRPDIPPSHRPAQQAIIRSGYIRQLLLGQPIDIHYHTFTPASLEAHLHAAGFVGGDAPRFAILARAERYPPGRDDGIALLLEKTAAATLRSPPPAATFTLRATAADRPALPLVCPVTLEPLEPADASLVATASRLPYAFDLAGRPNLLPPAGARPSRPWGDRGWGVSPPPNLALPPLAPMPALHFLAHFDEPSPTTFVDPLCFSARGWLWLGEAHATIAALELTSGEHLLGETTAFYARPDVNAAHGLPATALCGFEIFAHHDCGSEFARDSSAPRPFPLELRARFRDGTRSPVLAHASVAPIARDYRANHFGILLDRRTTAIQGHNNVFAVGPSQHEGSGEVATLLRRYLGPPPRKLIDVGCGFGSYGRGLLADGYDWLGVEVNAADCAELARLGLPHRQIDGRTLPFADASFDAALCIEVLEHIAEPRAFLREVARVAPRQLVVSVPNCELLGYLWDHLATPWHMLEASHVNYFTRWSLGALLREFYPHVELRFHTPYPLRTVEGTPLHYNLLAIASSPPSPDRPS